MNTGCRVQRSRFYSKKFCRWSLKSLRTADARLFGSWTVKSAVMTAPPLKAASRLKINYESCIYFAVKLLERRVTHRSRLTTTIPFILLQHRCHKHGFQSNLELCGDGRTCIRLKLVFVVKLSLWNVNMWVISHERQKNSPQISVPL